MSKIHDDIRWAARHVLASPIRLRFLLRDWQTPFALTRFLRVIVPLATGELERIREAAHAIADPLLRHEALASIEGKAYHVAGASVLATFLKPEAARHYVEIVAPLESIYDYLDNLCDRHPHVDRVAYPVLHQAIADALDPSATPRDYYACGPVGDDRGYLRTLVERTQAGLRRLDGHAALMPYFCEAASLYADMQTYTHLPAGERETVCVAWYERHRPEFPALQWHEFACAAGSQFQVYAPLFALFAGGRDCIEATYRAYFPWLSALHVLFDSFIDQAEDLEHGELNFAKVYGGQRELADRVRFLSNSSTSRMAGLPGAWRHRFVLRIMALFYLTHPKVFAQGLDREAQSLLRVI